MERRSAAGSCCHVSLLPNQRPLDWVQLHLVLKSCDLLQLLQYFRNLEYIARELLRKRKTLEISCIVISRYAFLNKIDV